MDERLMQFRIGVMVLASILIAAILLVTFGEWRWPFPAEYTIYIRFPEAPGVAERSPLRKSGIVIGHVTDVQLTPEGNVLVTARVERKYVLRRNEVCRLNRALLGDSTLEISLSPDPNASTEPLKEGDVMQGIVPPDPIVILTNLQERLVTAINSVNQTAADLGDTVRSVNRILTDNEQQLKDLLANANKTVTLAQQTVSNANDIVGDPELKQRLKDTLSRVPQVVDDLRHTLDEANQTIRVARENLDNLRGVTSPLAENGAAMVRRLDTSLQNLERVTAQLAEFGENLNREDSTLGRLVRDPTLYQKLDRTMTNVQQLTQDLRPVISDLRVFSDKIARHPELLGVRGALERQAGTKGLPNIPSFGEETVPVPQAEPPRRFSILPGTFR
ncbi:ABC transporter-related permease with MCE domain [Thermogutta terrifontis]|uniref:ABC transporter-related permease with MCE domain n=1 Tax=Thermogutta terrifontis TaxID=1331910 RepID=A0A286RBB3_9BACT|nr:MlaD family protein [Thermogutta terrifontis]ASV73254.1 ABC transporter-related permease with MCE domain [Thermogutta terrifontis]